MATNSITFNVGGFTSVIAPLTVPEKKHAPIVDPLDRSETVTGEIQILIE